MMMMVYVCVCVCTCVWHRGHRTTFENWLSLFTVGSKRVTSGLCIIFHWLSYLNHPYVTFENILLWELYQPLHHIVLYWLFCLPNLSWFHPSVFTSELQFCFSFLSQALWRWLPERLSSAFQLRFTSWSPVGVLSLRWKWHSPYLTDFCGLYVEELNSIQQGPRFI